MGPGASSDCAGFRRGSESVRISRRALRRRYYDLFALVYDRFVAWHSGEPTGPMRRALAERATGSPVRRVLDLCCGTGAVTRALMEGVPTGAVVVGLDFSRGMLFRGRAAVRQAGLSTICWVQADAAALPFKDRVFDAATCAYALYELKRPSRGIMLREAARVLVPEGRFLAMEHEVPTRRLPRLLFSLRLAVIGAEGAREFLEGELGDLGQVFSQVRKEVLPPGKSKILVGTKVSGLAAAEEEGGAL